MLGSIITWPTDKASGQDAKELIQPVCLCGLHSGQPQPLTPFPSHQDDSGKLPNKSHVGFEPQWWRANTSTEVT